MLQVVKNQIFGNNMTGNPTVIKIDTRNVLAGGTNENQYRLPFGYESVGFRFPKNKNVQVDWGDGTQSFHSSQADNIVHNYAAPGIYIVQMTPQKGGYIGISHEDYYTESEKLLEVLHFGDAYIERNGFAACAKLRMENVYDYPQFYYNGSQQFRGCTALSTIKNISSWQISELTILDGMFRDCFNFNQDLSSWDVKNVTSMTGMFRGATNFHQDISMWDFNKDAVLGLFLNGVVNYPPQYLSNLYIKFSQVFIGVGRTAIKNLNVGNNKYTSAGASARAALIADGWSITDGGMI